MENEIALLLGDYGNHPNVKLDPIGLVDFLQNAKPYNARIVGYVAMCNSPWWLKIFYSFKDGEEITTGQYTALPKFVQKYFTQQVELEYIQRVSNGN